MRGSCWKLTNKLFVPILDKTLRNACAGISEASYKKYEYMHVTSVAQALKNVKLLFLQNLENILCDEKH